jgi:two-component system response regulator (stage 0 sporulation protein A)
MIVDDNAKLAGIICDYLKKKEDIEIVATAFDGTKAIEILKTTPVDVLLLDIIMPNDDGFGVLDKMRSASLPTTPDVIVLSALGQEEIIRRISEYGIRYYMVKPFDLAVLYDRIIQTCSNPGQSVVRSVPEINIPASPRVQKYSLDEKITSIFLMIGIPAHIKGYHFLREAIRIVMDDTDIINRITKELYPTIAKRFDTSASKVERAIRHSIEVAWTRGKIENINKIFGYNIYTKNDKPTNGEFIALIADRLAMEQTA